MGWRFIHYPDEFGGAFWLMLQVHVQLAIGTVFWCQSWELRWLSSIRRWDVLIAKSIVNWKFNASLSNSLSGIRVVKAFANEWRVLKVWFKTIANNLNSTKPWPSSITLTIILMRIITLIALVSGACSSLKGANDGPISRFRPIG